MDRTRVMDLADKVGGLFRLTVLLQKRVRELVGGSPPLIETDHTNPIDIAMAEVEVDAIELVDLSTEELKALEAETKMASEEAEILEALRSRVTGGAELKSATAKPPKPKAPKVEAPKAEEAKAEEPKAEEAKAEEPKAEEPKAEEPKAEEAKVEEAPAKDADGDQEPKAEAAAAPAKDPVVAATDGDAGADDSTKAE